MGTKEEKDKARRAKQFLLGQLDTIDADIADVNSQLTGRGGLSRGGGSGRQFKIGDVSEATTADGKKVQVRLARGDGSRQEDWEIMEPKAEPAKAEPKAEPKAEVKEEPKEDTKKYIRRKNPRGGWIYEESSRGLTKAQYADIDKNK
jgi:hypothetical protein